MVLKAQEMFFSSICPLIINIDHLVSGGAAWADHIAVELYLKGLAPNLTLYLPCSFENGKYKDTGVFDFKTNPGGTLNYYHSLFSKKIGRNSLDDISRAIQKGAKIEIKEGFFARNSSVAKSDCLLAFTFGDGPDVKPGGSLDTVTKWRKLHWSADPNRGFHVDLHSFDMYCLLEYDFQDNDTN